jgi:hypothetical protein
MLSTSAATARDGERAHDLLHPRMAGTSVRGKGEEGHARLVAHECPPARGRGDRDIRQHGVVRIRVHGAVGVQQDALAQRHQEEAGRRPDAGCQPDRHHAGLDHPRGGMRHAREERIRVARLHHHAGVEEGLRDRPPRDLRVARPEGGILLEARVVLRRRREDGLREPFGAQPPRRLHDALVAGLGQHDAPAPRTRALEEPFQDVHGHRPHYCKGRWTAQTRRPWHP